MATKPRSSNDLSEERTDLSLERTALAATRTLLAWIRTGLSLIAFGFTIYEFLKVFASRPMTDAISSHGPRRIGLFLIALGVISIAFGTLEYCRMIAQLNQLTSRPYRMINASAIMGFSIGLLGVFLFITILLNTEVI
ncbi:YidH family protein [Marinobacter sp. F4206]|uniref:YidH family protein n=1 Tax=Marinobacter sp. F4206 TaxID=2861777 RepID=UPI001C5CD27C|nr:DUF202 domain-containing protein [Marinobacter sp. F4206]MBW4936034.1 DUF202 domain-containing protein [Marinobacter sp. F4206]